MFSTLGVVTGDMAIGYEMRMRGIRQPAAPLRALLLDHLLHGQLSSHTAECPATGRSDEMNAGTLLHRGGLKQRLDRPTRDLRIPGEQLKAASMPEDLETVSGSRLRLGLPSCRV